jgi:transitional endoplasmic reticulum ATPase
VTGPDRAARREIFGIHTRDKPLAAGVDLDDLVERTEGYVGADIGAGCREAAAAAVREDVESSGDLGDVVLTMAHFEDAFEEVDAGGAKESPGAGGVDTSFDPDSEGVESE